MTRLAVGTKLRTGTRLAEYGVPVGTLFEIGPNGNTDEYQCVSDEPNMRGLFFRDSLEECLDRGDMEIVR